ncbi:MAG: RAMP superfamily CRISPR-associated protein [Dorea sp.]|nr:RAMP superfamily CRISPR-associated protein [Dorea sp.]
MAAIMVMLECLTNLHAGNGDVNYNLIDNEVEKDPVTGYACINASGVKGALRAYLKKHKKCDEFFGNDKQGRLRILGANLLAMPMRASSGEKAFYLVSTQDMQDAYAKLYGILTGQQTDPEVSGDWTLAREEGISVEEVALTMEKTLMGRSVYKISAEDYASVPLPVIARNKLSDGKSENLWYEEVVPHETILYFPVISEDAKSDLALLREFRNAIHDKVIQFGGNASIGYGLCKVTVKELGDE